MYKRLIGKMGALAILAGAAGWLAVPQIASAVNPKQFIVVFNQNQPHQATTATKLVNFRAIVDNWGCFVDVVTPITTSTNYKIEALVKCSGLPSTGRTVSGSTTVMNDMNYICWTTPGQGMQGGLGITN